MANTNVTTSMLIAGTDIYAPKLINNVVDQRKNPTATVSCNMFKSESLYAADKKAPFSNYIRSALEPVAGGHYYARSFDKNTYQSCSCTIPLSKCSMTNGNGSRVACISLGIVTEGSSLYHHFDVGLSNAGDGWYPSMWGRDFLTKWNPGGATSDKPNLIHRSDTDVPVAIAPGDTHVIIPSTATVTVLVEVGRTSSVDWMRATFSHSGKIGKIAINVPRGTLFPNNSATYPTTRFNRFMSLIPANNSYTFDTRDYSRMEGSMENLKIGSSSWGATNLQHV